MLVFAQMSTTIDRLAARPTKNEVLLAFRGLVEQVRLGLHDSRRLIRRLIACHASTAGRTIQVPSSPTPLVSVPLVVLRPTTAREQIELHDLVQVLGADGYHVAPRGPHWVVYTEIADRRKPAIGRSAQDRRRSSRGGRREWERSCWTRDPGTPRSRDRSRLIYGGKSRDSSDGPHTAARDRTSQPGDAGFE
jgi:hypothetical protein